MNTNSDIVLNGQAVNSLFGECVSSAGDVNGDGYDDVIVGEPGNASTTGKAYIYFGGSPMNNVADVTLTGEANGSNFGKSVSNAGDVNGDGYPDVVVGAYGYSSGTGRVYVFYGGASMNSVSDVTMTGEAISNAYGYSVSNAGDVNGDGYSDVLVGAHGNNSSRGKAYIYFGSASMNNVADVTFLGEAVGNLFGFSVSTAGD
ncbi:MAG: FG-GAP repeat protein [Ignavibacteria bacterium]|nr:FG-GAP repeat protein [Ignavibacteria bacterium]